MATTITGKLNKPANIFQAGDSTGFGVRIGVKCRDPKTKADVWTNYSAVIFAKSAVPQQQQYAPQQQQQQQAPTNQGGFAPNSGYPQDNSPAY